MTLLFAFPEQDELAESLIKLRGYVKGQWTMRRFPDGESYVRILSDAHDQEAVILCSLYNPDDKIMPLIFLARTLKEIGCKKVSLITPYLGYMRQDIRFHDGEAITSTIFAGMLSNYIDALVTIDPHLHRHKTLGEIYSCEGTVLSAAPLMAQWIAKHVPNPIIIGPDNESEQWVKTVSGQSNAPYVILDKTRHGDRDVEISIPNLDTYKGRTPVLVDDIISTAATMIKAIELLRQQGFGSCICLATHSVFAEGAYENLLRLGDVQVVTTNAIPHISNGIDVAELLATAAH